MTQSRSLYYPL